MTQKTCKQRTFIILVLQCSQVSSVSIQPFFFSRLIPADFKCKAGYSLDWLPGNCSPYRDKQHIQTTIHTQVSITGQFRFELTWDSFVARTGENSHSLMDNLESSVNLTFMFWKSALRKETQVLDKKKNMQTPHMIQEIEFGTPNLRTVRLTC